MPVRRVMPVSMVRRVMKCGKHGKEEGNAGKEGNASKHGKEGNAGKHGKEGNASKHGKEGNAGKRVMR